MNNTQLNVERIRACDEDAWRTINGAKVLIDGESGTIKGGAGGKFTGQKFGKKNAGSKAEALKNVAESVKQNAGNKTMVGAKGTAFLRSISHVNSSTEENTGYMARDMVDMINKGKSLEDIHTAISKNIDKYSNNQSQDRRLLSDMINAVKTAERGGKPDMGPSKAFKENEKNDTLSYMVRESGPAFKKDLEEIQGGGDTMGIMRRRAAELKKLKDALGKTKDDIRGVTLRAEISKLENEYKTLDDQI